MSYARHTALDLTNAASQVVSAIPTTDELLVLMRGTQTNGVGDNYRLRPNSDSGANYGGAGHFASSSPSSGTITHPTNGFFFGLGIAGARVQTTMRLVKVGDYWLSKGQTMEFRSSSGFAQVVSFAGRWNSAGVALSSLQFRWDVDGGTVVFTGRIEVWYQE